MERILSRLDRLESGMNFWSVLLAGSHYGNDYSLRGYVIAATISIKAMNTSHQLTPRMGIRLRFLA